MAAALVYSTVFFLSCTAANPEQTASKQQVETAQQGGGIAATPTPTATPSPQPSPSPGDESDDDVKGPADVIYEYYASINSGDYRSAYELWSGKGEASKKSFEQFRSGFADTERTEVIIGSVGEEDAAAGSRYIMIPVTIKARTKSGKDQTFKGEYILRRSVVDGATDEQKAWRIFSATIKKS